MSEMLNRLTQGEIRAIALANDFKLKPQADGAARAVSYEEATRLREEPDYRWVVPKLLSESEMASNFTNELTFELNNHGHTWINWGRKAEGDDGIEHPINTENLDTGL
jgi:hypothetical protein